MRNTITTATRHLGTYLPLVLFLVLGFADVTMAAPRSSTVVTGDLISINIDEDYCEDSVTFCVETSQVGAASSTNGNPVLMVVQLISPSGAPITGLTSTAFTLRGAAAGNDLEIPSCTSCFNEIGDGLYLVAIEPIMGFNWVEGTYHYQLRVDVGPGIAYSLFEIEIPQ